MLKPRHDAEYYKENQHRFELSENTIKLDHRFTQMTIGVMQRGFSEKISDILYGFAAYKVIRETEQELLAGKARYLQLLANPDNYGCDDPVANAKMAEIDITIYEYNCWKLARFKETMEPVLKIYLGDRAERESKNTNMDDMCGDGIWNGSTQQ